MASEWSRNGEFVRESRNVAISDGGRAAAGAGGRGLGRLWATHLAGGPTTALDDSRGRLRHDGQSRQAWAETYHQQRPEVIVQVLGGGSGVGIASLIDGNCDMANSSRQMKPEEIEKTEASRGSKAVEHVVGFDAMGIYVHPSNPIAGISMEELAAIFGEHPSDHAVVGSGRRRCQRACRTRSFA